MRKSFSKFAQVAGIMLALVFTFSCSDDKDDGGSSGGSNTQGGCPNAATGNGTLSCGGQTYKTVEIGSQVWMAENLNYNVSGSKCYADGISGVSADSIANNCAKYGRLYDWYKANTACPSGWHLPSQNEWETLINSVGTKPGTKLKAKSGWNSYNGKSGNGTDDYGFSALPGGSSGYEHGDIIARDIGNSGSWWSRDGASGDNYASGRSMSYVGEDVAKTTYQSKENDLKSVRCVKD